VVPLQLLVVSVIGWFQSGQHADSEYLREENRVLKAQLRSQRVRLTDDERRRLAVLGARLGRRILAQGATIVTPDTILRWHRQLIARKMDLREASEALTPTKAAAVMLASFEQVSHRTAPLPVASQIRKRCSSSTPSIA
jgi:hypothetical protein